MLEQFYSQFNKLCVGSNIVPGTNGGVECVWFGGGDMKYTSVVIGTGGRFSGKGKCCPWCEVDRPDLGNLDPALQAQVPLRTLLRSYEMTHSKIPDRLVKEHGLTSPYGYTCPGCKQECTEAMVSRHLLVPYFCYLNLHSSFGGVIVYAWPSISTSKFRYSDEGIQGFSCQHDAP